MLRIFLVLILLNCDVLRSIPDTSHCVDYVTSAAAVMAPGLQTGHPLLGTWCNF